MSKHIKVIINRTQLEVLIGFILLAGGRDYLAIAAFVIAAIGVWADYRTDEE